MTKNSMNLDPNMIANFQTINQRRSIGLEEEILVDQSPLPTDLKLKVSNEFTKP